MGGICLEDDFVVDSEQKIVGWNVMIGGSGKKLTAILELIPQL